MRITAWIAGLAAALAAIWITGAAQATSPEFDKCMNTGAAADGVTVAMRNCSGAEGDRQNRTLNTLYKQAMSRLDQAGRERLQRQERTWLKMRNIACDLEAQQNYGGTAALLGSDSCWLDLNDKRIAELGALAKGEPPHRPDISETAKAASRTYRQCIGTSGGAVIALQACADQEGQRQDHTLNSLYQQAMAHYEDEDRADLRRLQRAWLKTRDAKCASDMEWDAGSPRGLLEVANCRLDVTGKRIGELKEMATGQDVPPY
jgi:uncharacterized protein YecT (DUF1311 family)